MQRPSKFCKSTSRFIRVSTRRVLTTPAQIEITSCTQLQAIFTPTISVDYIAVSEPIPSAIPSTVFVRRISSAALLGNPNVETQHLSRGCKWATAFPSVARMEYQVRAAHPRGRICLYLVWITGVTRKVTSVPQLGGLPWFLQSSTNGLFPGTFCLECLDSS